MKGASFYELLNIQKNLQVVLDLTQNIYNNTHWKNYFQWGLPQVDTNFKAMEVDSEIAPMASVISYGSGKPNIGADGVSFYGGSIPKIGLGMSIGEQEMRQLMQLNDLQMPNFSGNSAAKEVLFTNVNKIIQGTHARLNNFSDQALTTGKVITTVDNNPQGIVISVDLRIPTGNKVKAGFAQSSPAAWTDETNSDPVQDLYDMDEKSRDEFRPIELFLMSKTLWKKFVKHPKVMDFARRNIIGISSTYAITPDDVKNALSRWGLPPIVVVDEKQRVYVDGLGTAASGWDDDIVVGATLGNLGVMNNAISMHTLAPSTTTDFRTTTENGRFSILNHWDSELLINTITLETLAVPTFNNPKRIYQLDTATAHS